MDIGIRGLQKLEVNENNTAKALGSGTLEVFASPAMISLMENTCMNSIANYLHAGETSVGTLLNVSHVSASAIASQIVCESELVEIDRKRLVFKVKASDNYGLIGEGLHERFIVNIDKFMDRTNNKGLK